MSEGEPMLWHDAKRYADEFAGLVSDVCTGVNVAGSVRRRRSRCNDIEIVATPILQRLQSTLDGDIAGIAQRNELHDRMQALKRDGRISTDRPRKDGRKNSFGPKYYRIGYSTADGHIVPVDLFAVIPPAQYGTLLLLRTGSDAFSKWIVQYRQRDGYVFRDGHLEHITTGTVDTPDEGAVFKALGLPFIPPEKRDLTPWGGQEWLKVLRR